MEYRLTIPGEPKSKRTGKIGKNKKTGARFLIANPETVSHENLIRYTARQTFPGLCPLEGPLVLFADFYRAMPKSILNSPKKRLRASVGDLVPITKPDLDNYLKALKDGLKTILFLDDNQIVEIHARKLFAGDPRTEIQIIERP